MNRIANYTFAVGVRKHEFELHATGCRDLKHLSPATIRWQTEASDHDAAVAAFGEEAPGAVVFIQACCNPRRMAAVGRIRYINAVAADVSPLYLAGIAIPQPVAVAAEVDLLEVVAEAVTAPLAKAKKSKKAKAA